MSTRLAAADFHQLCVRWFTAAGLAALAVLNGCAALQVHIFKNKVYLNKVPVTTMAATFPKGPGIAPGDKLPLVVTFTTADGKVFVTEGEGHGQILWQDLNVYATVASVNKKGVLSLPSDPRFSEGRLPHVSITAPSHPGLKAELDIPVRYDRNYKVSFAGRSGFNGENGTAGTDGMSGSTGSIDLNNPQPGGNGTDGSDGTDGKNGEDGADGPPVLVRVTLSPRSVTPLLQISVQSQRDARLFEVDPQGGSVTITSVGGSGGSGGQGGRGGKGGRGGSGSPNGQDGRDGRDGNNGLSGSTGRDGRITIIYDPKAGPFLRAIRVFRRSAPAPIFREEPVPALW